MWFDDIWKFLSSKLELLEAISDPSRVFNQDETAIEHGVSDQWVLAERGKKQVYQVTGSSTREHTTIFYTISASGNMVPPRIAFSGVRDLAKSKLKLGTTGLSGKWTYSYTAKGWVNQETYIEIIEDLVKHVKEQKIWLPVILIIDGATCHISLEISRLCIENQIQPILL